MKKPWLKITAVSTFSILVIVIVLFWHSWSHDGKQAAKSDKTQQAIAAKVRSSNLRADKLYQIALEQKNVDNPSAKNYMITLDCCHQIVSRYPHWALGGIL